MQVAARYQSQQYLIGPAVFPTYWFVLRTAFLWTFVIYSIVSVVQIFSSEVPSATAVVEAVFRLPAIFMTTAAWVTLTFAGLEFVVTHYPTKWPVAPGSSSARYSPDWSPSSLPPLEKQGVPGMKQRTFAHASAEVIFGALLLAWLLLIPSIRPSCWDLAPPTCMFRRLHCPASGPCFIGAWWRCMRSS
jgi:hypothetical protein